MSCPERHSRTRLIMSQFRSEFWLQPNEPTWKEGEKKATPEEKKKTKHKTNTDISVNLYIEEGMLVFRIEI